MCVGASTGVAKKENWTGSEVKQVLTRNWSSVVWKWGEVGRLLYRGEGTLERERARPTGTTHKKWVGLLEAKGVGKTRKKNGGKEVLPSKAHLRSFVRFYKIRF
jgi:hypothetical protein